MSRFETILSAGRQAEQLTTAFYRFLELRGVPDDADAWVRTETIGAEQRCTVALWSEEASREFQAYLNRFLLPPPTRLTRRFGPSRFDDL